MLVGDKADEIAILVLFSFDLFNWSCLDKDVKWKTLFLTLSPDSETNDKIKTYLKKKFVQNIFAALGIDVDTEQSTVLVIRLVV